MLLKGAVLDNDSVRDEFGIHGPALAPKPDKATRATVIALHKGISKPQLPEAIKPKCLMKAMRKDSEHKLK